MGTAIKGFSVFTLVIALAFAATMLLCQNNDVIHPEAPGIKAMVNATNPLEPKGPCDGFELYYSDVRGTVLILCGLPNSNQWGGIVFRCTANMGKCWLDAQSYEASCFGSTRRYWMRVVTRDGYVPLISKPSIHKLFIGSYWG